jgi:hypothetical protein
MTEDGRGMTIIALACYFEEGIRGILTIPKRVVLLCD